MPSVGRHGHPSVAWDTTHCDIELPARSPRLADAVQSPAANSLSQGRRSGPRSSRALASSITAFR
ncbi:hypothetical protein ACFFX0_30155 [Citricoccus parietis]|uniref:Uncharacterized protein n=1 Tax=Citricoccus parietis TaxID=592307 RepID=A0ABV5FTF6_9MICC